MFPRPLPTAQGIAAMPWWAPLGGVIGAFAVIAGLLFVGKVGAGAFAGLTITANILMSLVIDHFGLFGVEQHSLGLGRAMGAVLMVAGRSNSVLACSMASVAWPSAVPCARLKLMVIAGNWP